MKKKKKNNGFTDLLADRFLHWAIDFGKRAARHNAFWPECRVGQFFACLRLPAREHLPPWQPVLATANITMHKQTHFQRAQCF